MFSQLLWDYSNQSFVSKAIEVIICSNIYLRLREKAAKG